MKTESTNNRIKHYASKQDYLNRKESLKSLEKVKDAAAHNVSLSKDVKKNLKEDLKQNTKEVSKAAERLAKDAASVATKALKVPGSSLLIPDIGVDIEVDQVEKAKEVDKIKALSPIERPGIFFVSGLHLNGISGDGGIPEIAESIEGADHFTWKDEDKIIEEIIRRPKGEPIMLVGHSLGGDAVVSIANKLNTPMHGFRKVELLVTLDSVGFDNDIIPSNVKKNHNFILDEDMFFNDGPNVARNIKTTEVINELRSEGHTKIDEASDVQSTIISNIDLVLERKERREQANEVVLALKELSQRQSSLDSVIS